MVPIAIREEIEGWRKEQFLYNNIGENEESDLKRVIKGDNRVSKKNLCIRCDFRLEKGMKEKSGSWRCNAETILTLWIEDSHGIYSKLLSWTR